MTTHTALVFCSALFAIIATIALWYVVKAGVKKMTSDEDDEWLDDYSD